MIFSLYTSVYDGKIQLLSERETNTNHKLKTFVEFSERPLLVNKPKFIKI